MTSKRPNNIRHSIDRSALPRHVAIIMDGNRRWARRRGLSDSAGHQAGAENLQKIVEYCRDLGIKHLTVYALSTENWRKRPVHEVKAIFQLLLDIVKKKAEEYRHSGIKFFVLGNFQAFPLKVRDAVKKIISLAIVDEKIQLNVALNYGGRDEIIQAVQNIVRDEIPAGDITEELIAKYLYTHDQPDPDLIIRPGGEFRLSNFLLWQMSYAELYFTDTLWPDFSPQKLDEAIYWYQQRDRRLGK